MQVCGRWRSHFCQKLQDEPTIEHTNMCSAYDQLHLAHEWDQSRFEAWCAGKTGYPMVDAVMRALAATGWINFRMRAMVVSFACYHLWLDWRKISDSLARLFLDYEPGVATPRVPCTYCAVLQGFIILNCRCKQGALA